MAEPTATLADSLLDDLDDLSDVVEDDIMQEAEEGQQGPEDEGGEVATTENGEPLASSSDPSETDKATTLNSSSRRKFLNDPALKSHVDQIRESDATTKKNGEASLSDRKEHEEHENRLVMQSNKHLARVAEELARAHRDLCWAYHPKFPELEELVVDPSQYKSAVRIIMNETDLTRVSEALGKFLTSNQIITISVAASTTSGRVLTDSQLDTVAKAADYMDELSSIQRELSEFVESRMQNLAPSICALVGPTTAAKLMGLAGGLAQLSKIPACNLQVLGQVKQSAASRGGLSAVSTHPHAGILSECALVRECPSYLQKKALKVLAAKLALAARCDFVNVDTGRQRSASPGLSFRREIETKIEQWQAPEKAQVLKALPKPDLTVKKRRGGKRIRRLKERFEETEMMKQANTRAFSAQTGEYGDDAMGLTMGMLDTVEGVGGSLRKPTEKRKTRQANTKASRKRAMQMQQAAAGSSNGMASSMVFTPVQGMELVDPDAHKNRVKEANQKWFSENAGFQSALPKK